MPSLIISFYTQSEWRAGSQKERRNSESLIKPFK